LSVNVTGTFSGSSAVRLRLVAQQTSATQTTVTVNYTLSIERPSGSGFFALSGSGNSWTIVTSTPTNGSGSNFTYDFRSPTNTRSFQIASINRTINVSGPTTRQVSASASQPQAGGIGSASTSTGTLTLTPLAPPPTPPSWTTTSFNEIARVGSSVLFQVSANNASSYSIASGSLPPGLSLNSSGFITGTASTGTSQAFNFIVRANGTGGASSTDSNIFTINRRQPLPVWADNTLNTTNLRVGTAFSDSVSATNSSSYTVNGLPAGGLTFSGGTASATVSGTPTSTSSFSFTINALNADGNSISQSFTFTPKPRLPVFTDSTLSTTTVRVNQSYTDGVSATNATSYAVQSGALPPGVELSTVDGAISGAPTAVGTYTFVLRATNSASESVSTGSLSITVEPAGAGKVWNGAAWVQAPFKVWSGAAWVEAPVKAWNGAAWVDPLS